MLLTMPMIQNIAKPTANGPSSRRTPPPIGLLMKLIVIPRATAPPASADLPGELPAGAEVEPVVGRAEGRRDRPAEEERDGPRRLERAWNRDEIERPVDQQEERGHEQERRRNRQPARSRHRHQVDPASIGPVHDPVAEDDAPDERGEDQRQQGRRR